MDRLAVHKRRMALLQVVRQYPNGVTWSELVDRGGHGLLWTADPDLRALLRAGLVSREPAPQDYRVPNRRRGGPRPYLWRAVEAG